MPPRRAAAPDSVLKDTWVLGRGIIYIIYYYYYYYINGVCVCMYVSVHVHARMHTTFS